MKQRLMAFGICLILLLSLCGCHRAPAASPLREDSAGTGYGALQKSALKEQDLYFLTYGLNRAQVVEVLGSPAEALLTADKAEGYRLQDGRRLEIIYSPQDHIQSATLTNQQGEKEDLFDYLIKIGILKTVGTTTTPSAPQEKPEEPQQPEEEAPGQEEIVPQPEQGFFSDDVYLYAVADQIIKEGALRETVVSALGKPNRFSSVDFAADGYLIDVYVMEDGSSLYLDYGYQRSQLRAVRKMTGSTVSDLIGTWGAEQKPNQFYRYTKNKTLFRSVMRGTTPDALYKRFGEPDWFEGEENHLRAAYQLINGAVIYFDFGDGNRGLSSAFVREQDGSISVFGLRG